MISGRMEYWLKIPSSLSKDQKVFRISTIDEESPDIRPLSRWLRNYASRYLDGLASIKSCGQGDKNPWRLASGMHGYVNSVLKEYMEYAPNVAPNTESYGPFLCLNLSLYSIDAFVKGDLKTL